ncbi:helix-turn-helix domain-containing protein [Lactiplantibacillus daowaiensis]|uniref:Helix-turn-helix domain-containing protein n=1 Tax=Lactiplantibacillus daowaiensis TaxID=2559918 RepID=A0ABW1RYS8_9LACO|nr:helix-turn-helix transcriptional regulator [Lactiplantibacillus daowaiensis]
MEIGERLREQRQARQLSQAKLAVELHISRQSISKWENGTALPSFANVVAISDLFGISLDELIKGDVALMNHLKSDQRFSPVGKIVTIGLSIGIGLLLLLTALNITVNQVSDWLAGVEVVGFIGLMITTKWQTINQALSKKAVAWGIVWLAAMMVPIMHDVVMGFVAGINSYH